MQIERKDTRIVVTAHLPEGHRELSLGMDEAGRLVAGESFLRDGLIIRRLGNVIELRTASPGIAWDRRVLATAHVDSFLSA
jgi:hypothetical protein